MVTKAMTTKSGWLAAAGACMLVATASYITATTIMGAQVEAPDFLAGLSGDQMRIGVLLTLITAAANVGVGVLLYPYLRKYYEGLALGYTATKLVDGILMAVGSLGLLLLPGLAERFAGAAAAEGAQLQTLATLAADSSELTLHATTTLLGAGSLLLCYILYRARLVPRWMSVLGFVSYVALTASGVAGIFGATGNAVYALYGPGAVFEVAFPLWLIFRGLNEPAAPSTPAQAQTAAPAVY